MAPTLSMGARKRSYSVIISSLQVRPGVTKCLCCCYFSRAGSQQEDDVWNDLVREDLNRNTFPCPRRVWASCLPTGNESSVLVEINGGLRLASEQVFDDPDRQGTPLPDAILIN